MVGGLIRLGWVVGLQIIFSLDISRNTIKHGKNLNIRKLGVKVQEMVYGAIHTFHIDLHT